MTSIATEAPAVEIAEERGPGRLRRLGRVARQKPLGAFGGAIIVILIITALFGQDITIGGEVIVPGFAPFPAERTDVVNKLSGPSASHIAGTDALGRDMFSRIIFGARTAMIVGLAATALGIAIGTIIGTVSPYIGGAADMVVQRLSDSMQALPPLVLLMVLVTMMSPGVATVIFAIVIFLIPGTQRVIRGTVLSVMQFTYIEAARTVGASAPRIIFRHILPNIVAPVMVLATVTIGGTILAEAALSFLSLGGEFGGESDLGVHSVRVDVAGADHAVAVAGARAGGGDRADRVFVQRVRGRAAGRAGSAAAGNGIRRVGNFFRRRASCPFGGPVSPGASDPPAQAGLSRPVVKPPGSPPSLRAAFPHRHAGGRRVPLTRRFG